MDESRSKASSLLALMRVPGAGNGVARTALRVSRQLNCGIDALLTMTPRALLEALPPGDYSALARAIQACSADHREAGQRLVARCSKTGIAFLTVDDPRYPASVLDCLGDRAPALLSVIGDFGLFEKSCVAVVGAREVSDTGLSLARACGRDIARADRVLVSGGAKGVDDAGQRGAADAGGGIVVVLPQGLLTFRGAPYIRDVLRERRALLVSACLPDAPWQQHAAIERNDVIAALSEAVCVIEPKKTGGSIRTAKSALEYGRHVLVHCAAETKAACDELVRAGAMPLVTEGDWVGGIAAAQPKARSQQTSLPGID